MLLNTNDIFTLLWEQGKVSENIIIVWQDNYLSRIPTKNIKIYSLKKKSYEFNTPNMQTGYVKIEPAIPIWC